MSTMNVSLTPELIKIVQSKVDSGLYNNASEVIREAIRQLDSNKELIYQLKLERLRQALAKGLAQADAGEYKPYDFDAIMSRLDKGIAP